MFIISKKNDTGFVWYMCLNTCFQFLNNITRIFTHFFTYPYFQKIQTTLLKQHYQRAIIFKKGAKILLKKFKGIESVKRITHSTLFVRIDVVLIKERILFQGTCPNITLELVLR